jgi:hypothetical protein
MTLLDRIEDAYLNGGGLNLSADDVRELRDWFPDETVWIARLVGQDEEVSASEVAFFQELRESSEGDTFDVELPEVKRTNARH